MDMKVEGDTVTLSGSVVGSECNDLEALLSGTAIKRVVLTNSGGGDARAGYCVGDLLCARGLATVIRGRCASSSRMWLGGVDRTLDGRLRGSGCTATTPAAAACCRKPRRSCATGSFIARPTSTRR